MTENVPSDMENIVPAEEFSFPEPHPWPHSPNPTGIRRDKYGRIALKFAWRGKDYVPTDGWVVLSAPNGLLEIEHLSNDDVADWTTVEMP